MNGLTIFWLVFAVVMAVLEGCTAQLVSIWFTIGGVAACVTSLFTDNIIIQAVVFIVVTGVALAATRPLVRKLKRKKAEPTNADRYIGKKGVVIDDIDNDIPQGMVRVDNQKWTARSESGEKLSKGDAVTVSSIEGVKLIVRKLD